MTFDMFQLITELFSAFKQNRMIKDRMREMLVQRTFASTFTQGGLHMVYALAVSAGAVVLVYSSNWPMLVKVAGDRKEPHLATSLVCK